MKLDLKIYRSYANEQEIIVSGHLFKREVPELYESNNSWFKHAKSVISKFRIKTVANAQIIFKFGEIEANAVTTKDGNFKITIPYHIAIASGWHTFNVTANYHAQTVKATGEFVKPHPGEYGIISDIDDTFLVSHSASFFKKLYVMLTKNVHKRRVFDDVVAHYRLLNKLGRKDNNINNAFFYVSSSEWNLYDFIIRFTEIHEFPKAILKLKNIKTGIADFLFTGGGNHNHKFDKIKEIIECYPKLRFVLLGDDSQKDAFIYQDICKMFPSNISTVYIRQTKSYPKKKVQQVLKNIEQMGVKVCYFKNSKDAIKHTMNHLG